MSNLITPYGGSLVDLLVKGKEREDLLQKAVDLPSFQISERAICDLELLATGAFSPLDRFMNESDYLGVLNDMKLSDGTMFPMPVTLSLDEEELKKEKVQIGSSIVLRSLTNDILAILEVDDIYAWDLEEVSLKVFGTTDDKHPIVKEMLNWGNRNLSGALKVVNLPAHHDFYDYRMTPAQTRDRLEGFGYSSVVAFQTRNPMHRVHEELTKRASNDLNAVLLLQPVVGMTKPGDVDHYTRVRTYISLTEKFYEKDRILLSLLPLAMRMGGPREALWHSIIRRNYGATHLIVGRDHAGPGNDSTGTPYYGPYDARDACKEYANEIGVSPVEFKEIVYVTEMDKFEEVTKIPEGAEIKSISGTQVREDYLELGISLPEWFTRPEVASILSDSYPPKNRQGACIWLTGLSGAGKSTIANILTVLLMEQGRRVSVLDGDVVRTNLSKGLGFSKEDRDTNILRVGYVASEIVSHGGLVICAAISPYQSTRDSVRNMMPGEHFIETYVDAPLDVCERRDVKGMYAKARAGIIKDFTGIDDPYESPVNPEIALDTVKYSAYDSAKQILEYISKKGLLPEIG